MSTECTQIAHYTKLSNFINMLKNDHLEVWLSDYRWLNDKDELTYFNEVMIDKVMPNWPQSEEQYKEIALNALNDVRDFKMQFFIFSLTKSIDCASFWNSSYANDKGLAIVFKDDGILPFTSENVEYNIDEVDSNVIVDDVIFHSIDMFNHLKKKIYVDEVSDSDFVELMLISFRYAILFKSIHVKKKCWSNEREHRAVFVKSKSEENYYDNDVKYNVNSRSIIPYVKGEIKLDKIDHILLGPTFTEYEKEAIENYLFRIEGGNYKNIKVKMTIAKLNLK